MPSALAIIGFVTIAAVGAAAGLAFDRHGPIGWHANLIVVHPGFDLPPSLAMRADAAEKAEKLAQDAQNACRTALGSQTAAVNAQAARSAAALDWSAKQVAAVQPRATHYASQGDALAAVMLGKAGDLERWTDADAAVREALK